MAENKTLYEIMQRIEISPDAKMPKEDADKNQDAISSAKEKLSEAKPIVYEKLKITEDAKLKITEDAKLIIHEKNKLENHAGQETQSARISELIKINPKHLEKYTTEAQRLKTQEVIDKGNVSLMETLKDGIESLTKKIQREGNHSIKSQKYCDRGIFYSMKWDIDKNESNLENAIADCNEAIKLDPLNGDAYSCRGSVQISRKNYSQAAEDLNRGIELGAKDQTTYYTLAKAYFKKGDFNKALEEYAYIIRANSDGQEISRARIQKGLCHSELGQHELAIEEYTKAMTTNRQLPILEHMYRAFEYHQIADKNIHDTQSAAAYDAAIKDYKKSLELVRDHSGWITIADNNLAVIYYKRKETKNLAIPLLENVLKQNGEFAEGHYNLGLCYENAQQHDKAQEEYAKAHKLDNEGMIK